MRRGKAMAHSKASAVRLCRQKGQNGDLMGSWGARGRRTEMWKAGRGVETRGTTPARWGRVVEDERGGGGGVRGKRGVEKIK